MIDLGDLAGGIDDSFARDINESMQIVGTGNGVDGSRGVLWRGFGGLTDLNTFDPIGGAGWVITAALAINDRAISSAWHTEGWGCAWCIADKQ